MTKQTSHPSSNGPHSKGSDTDAGAEAARGIRGTPPGPDKGDHVGSEPLKERKQEHRSGYGGKGGSPDTSSDQR